MRYREERSRSPPLPGRARPPSRSRSHDRVADPGGPWAARTPPHGRGQPAPCRDVRIRTGRRRAGRSQGRTRCRGPDRMRRPYRGHHHGRTQRCPSRVPPLRYGDPSAELYWHATTDVPSTDATPHTALKSTTSSRGLTTGTTHPTISPPCAGGTTTSPYTAEACASVPNPHPAGAVCYHRCEPAATSHPTSTPTPSRDLQRRNRYRDQHPGGFRDGGPPRQVRRWSVARSTAPRRCPARSLTGASPETSWVGSRSPRSKRVSVSPSTG